MAEIVFKNSDFRIPCEKLNKRGYSYITFDLSDDAYIKRLELGINGGEGIIGDVILIYDSKNVIESNMEFDRNLTKKLRKILENYEDDTYPYLMDKVHKILEEQGYKIEFEGWTRNDEYFLGDIDFEFVSFISKNKYEDEGVVILWDDEYEIKVYKGWFQETYLSLSPDHEFYLQEVAYMFGYDGDFEAMNEDFRRQYFEKCLNNQISESYRKHKLRKRFS